MPTFLHSNLKVLRNEKSITQDGLASHMGKGRTTINNWEKQVSQPNLSEIQELCNFFGISCDCLLFSDLSDVQVTDRRKPSKNQGNVQGNVQASVQVKPAKAGKTDQGGDTSPPWEKALNDARKTNEILSVAVRGLEAANAVLIRDLEQYREQIELLKGGPTSIRKDMEIPIPAKAGL